MEQDSPSTEMGNLLLSTSHDDAQSAHPTYITTYLLTRSVISYRIVSHQDHRSLLVGEAIHEAYRYRKRKRYERYIFKIGALRQKYSPIPNPDPAHDRDGTGTMWHIFAQNHTWGCRGGGFI